MHDDTRYWGRGNLCVQLVLQIFELALDPLSLFVADFAGLSATLEARAKARGSAILAKLPKYRGQVYTYSSSPNWYTRVGNFRTNAEASAALTEMKKAFPNFASEMRIVKCQIVVIK